MNQRELFLRHVAQTSQEPMLVEIVRAEGVYQYGPDGKAYLDLISGIGVSNLGHCVPEVVAAVQAQAAHYMHSMVYGEFVLSPQVAFATELTAAIGHGLDNVYFVNSGSEATEGALKLAKKFTGRQEIIAMHRSYHGSTHGALSVTGSPELKAGYGPFLEGIRFAEFNDLSVTEMVSERTAAVILEPVQGEAGIVPADAAFLQALRQRCDATGTLLIFDECQSGFGRTGSLFAFQAYGVVPDVLLLGKGLGGGMPMGAFVARREVMQVLTKDPVLGHISTFGGHPVCCAAGLAALRKLQAERLHERAAHLEAVAREVLDDPAVLEVRGKGLMLAAEVGDFDVVLDVIHACVERGIITDWFLHCNTAIRIAPPLVIAEADFRQGLEVLLEEIRRARGL